MGLGLPEIEGEIFVAQLQQMLRAQSADGCIVRENAWHELCLCEADRRNPLWFENCVIEFVVFFE